MLLITPLYEPCGLTQMYALKYGTVPIVRAVEGLKDSIQEFSYKTGTGTGFKFKAPQTKFPEISRKRLILFSTNSNLEKLMLNGMGKDNSWEFVAKQYSRLYQKTLRSRKSNKS